MAQILVRDLDKRVVDKLKKRAKEDGRSLQSEAKKILEEAVRQPKLDVRTARKLSERFRTGFKGRKFPDTVKLIREDRDR
ncbi:MAG: Arc family DNA-binding protein [Nitrospinota bacterium]